MSGLRADAEHPEVQPPGSGCGPRLAGLLIVFFANVPLVNVGWSRLWDVAPVLLVVALVIDAFLLLLVVLWWLRRRGRGVSAQDPPGPPPA
ncbi:MAG TPA: hypothetical protein VN088_01995 [Nocardioides sp.]|nr:hypothetical protein [Nocardioides sp.]